MNNLTITVSSEDGRFKHTEVIDLDELFEELKVDFPNPDINEYRSLQKFHVNEIDMYNGNHYIFGYWESLCQSDWMPHWIREHNYKVFIACRLW